MDKRNSRSSSTSNSSSHHSSSEGSSGGSQKKNSGSSSRTPKDIEVSKIRGFLQAGKSNFYEFNMSESVVYDEDTNPR